jgi:hypothetical protein
MHRLTARLLLLFALAGSLVPLATAVTAAPSHACCVRKAAHHCHEPAVTDSSRLVIRDTGCCSHDCCRAVTISKWARAQSATSFHFTQNVRARLDRPVPVFLNTEVLEFHSGRAPPFSRS